MLIEITYSLTSLREEKRREEIYVLLNFKIKKSYGLVCGVFLQNFLFLFEILFILVLVIWWIDQQNNWQIIGINTKKLPKYSVGCAHMLLHVWRKKHTDKETIRNENLDKIYWMNKTISSKPSFFFR